MKKIIICKDCNQDFIYEYQINPIHGFRGVNTKKFCKKCIRFRKLESAKKQSKNKYKPKPKSSKSEIIKSWILYLTNTKKYKNTSDLYDNLFLVLPENFSNRNTMRRCYFELQHEQ